MTSTAFRTDHSRRAWSAGHALADFGRRHRAWIAYSAYALATALALVTAFALRYDLEVPTALFSALPWLVVGLISFRLVAAWAFQLMAGRWRYVGSGDLLRLAAAAAVSTAAFLVWNRWFSVMPPVPLSVVFIEWALFCFGVSTVWLLYRAMFEGARGRAEATVHDGRRIVIVGAGEAGHLLLEEIQRQAHPYEVVGFLDDDPLKKGTRIRSGLVLGGTAEARQVLPAEGIDEIVIAIPSAEPADLRRILANLEPLGIPFRVLPGIPSVFEGDARLRHLRPLRIEDLLGREPVTLEIPELEADLRGRTVLVTGAAGSVGSELARQIAANGPDRLLLLDQAESDLYFTELELRRAYPDLEIRPVVGDILDETRLAELFDAWKPDQIYHAAAYKHVPLMEVNRREAIRNNVIGTWQIARIAGERRVHRFILISTDKAADPSSVMGATKRAAEVLMQELQEAYESTHFAAVRFGNVLGSSGSVIPLFQRQIAAGRPLTITHPDVSRYFMTIPEAVRLVLKAGLLPEARGQIAMLEMGEPLRIVDLARNLVRLSGLRPEIDIPFEYTGLRPGEKLHETLHGESEVLQDTSLPEVSIVHRTPASRVTGFLSALDRYDRKGEIMSRECVSWLQERVLGGMINQPLGARPSENGVAPQDRAAPGAGAGEPTRGIGERVW